jgi:hypothetical protein
MSEPNYDKIKIVVGGEEVILDPENLKFNEATLSRFLENEGSWYDYFGRHLANAEIELASYKELSEVTYLRAFDGYKAEGSSDKRAEAQARIENAVIDARQRVLEAEKNVKLLKSHLRSFDQSHNNSISLGYTLRKEMDKLQPRIYGDTTDTSSNASCDYEAKLEQVIRNSK